MDQMSRGVRRRGRGGGRGGVGGGGKTANVATQGLEKTTQHLGHISLSQGLVPLSLSPLLKLLRGLQLGSGFNLNNTIECT